MQNAIHAGFQILEQATYKASYVKWRKSKYQMIYLKTLNPKHVLVQKYYEVRILEPIHKAKETSFVGSSISKHRV